MAQYSITGEAAEALTAATAETLLQLIGHANCKPKILEWGVSFDGASATAVPVRIRFLRQTTAGTSSAATERAWDPDSPTPSAAGFHSFTAEPTADAVLADYYVHPQSGIFVQYPLGREPVIDNSTASRLAIECTAPAGVNAVGYLCWEE